MDFSKFRASGDLSDMVVVVDGQEHHLHRFPLYAKSDFFCGLARSPSGRAPSPSAAKCRVELDDFPGGQAVFSLVADFCYNMAPRVSRDNVVQLRCAAQKLLMEGPGNLADAADKFLQDTIAAAKLSRSCEPLVTLLLQCASVGQLAARAGVVLTCTDALVDTWLRYPAHFSSSTSTSSSSSHSISGNNHNHNHSIGSSSSNTVVPSPGSAFTMKGSAFTPMKPSVVVTSGALSSSGAAASGGDVSGGGGGGSDEGTVDRLCRLPEDWFADLLAKALSRGVRQSQLAEMAVRYVSLAVDKEHSHDATTSNNFNINSNTNTAANNNNNSKSNDGSGLGPANGHSTPVMDVFGALLDSVANTSTTTTTTTTTSAQPQEDLDKDVDSLGDEEETEEELERFNGGGHSNNNSGGNSNSNSNSGGVVVSPRASSLLPHIPERAVDLGKLLDTVLTTLPEEAYNVPCLTMAWLTKVLRVATSRGCSCRRFLVKIAADKLSRLPAEDLCIVSPSVLHDIVLEGAADDSQAERACNLLDTYLGEMSKKGVLTAETYRLLANAAPSNIRRNHDNLYDVLEYVLKAEKESLSPDQRQDLVSTINLDLVTEDTLRRALESDLVSPDPVARAALKLCAGLRSELDSVKYIAQMQEEELHKFGVRALSPRASPRAGASAYLGISSSKLDSDSGFSDHDNKDSASEHVRAAQSVLNTARSKLATPLYTGHRPAYLPSSAVTASSSSSAASHQPSSSSSYPGLSGLEHDLSLQDQLDYRLQDRSTSFRSLEPRVRSRHVPGAYSGSSVGSGSGSGSGSSSQHHRSTYFPYSSQRY